MSGDVMYPNADTDSLALYYLASRKSEKAANELIAELRDTLIEILATPMWVSIGEMGNVARVDIPKELFDRAWSLVEKSE